MLRFLFILMPSVLLACSKDQPTPVAPSRVMVDLVSIPTNGGATDQLRQHGTHHQQGDA